MDPIEEMDIRGDSTFVMMLEAQARGHRVDYALMPSLHLEGDRPGARVQRAEVRREIGDHFSLGNVEDAWLDEYDAVFMRKDPPFDTDFHLATLILDMTRRDRTVLVNEPRALRDFNEKLSALRWSRFMPPTIATADRARIRSFLNENGTCIVKPLVNAGGEGIIRLEPNDKNTGSVLDLLTLFGKRMIEAQKFVPDVTKGDKRILLVNGEPIGAINRVPAKDDHRANMHVGGRAEAVGLDDRDREICDALGPSLRENGLALVGIDVIGGFLTEINVTSPTGLQELASFDGVHGERILLDWLEDRLAGR